MIILIREKTEKVRCHKVLYEATEKHPAQIDQWTEDKVVGKFTTKLFSGKMTPIDKSQILARLDKVIAEVKKARMRANQEEAKESKIAKQLFDYILRG